ncbi:MULTISPECIES: phosphatidylglycerol lysyltransferase domain-containing protein [unclassified Aureimonas]|uniref:phosphatidylglycerol lysyltransferase domain-containing protein n=1 Tax=unclassified Aureimonas TaxID=2615206 RepID=UPI0007140A48|nr:MULTISPECIES: phosphatidylglycerol lysyltransferase domain-containing protein [unclassified Aureimonas]KQT80431.1 hypothetical protein ASG54_07625 [Aureimonas sp. Leaf460]
MSIDSAASTPKPAASNIRFLRPVDGSRRAGLMTSLKSLVQPKAPAPVLDAAQAMEAAVRIVERQGLGEANLVRMADKDILFSEDGEAFVMYARRGRSMIALSDPIGPADRWEGLVHLFCETARASGCRPVFYQASPALLGACFEAGLKSLKLGEQAVVDLATFDMKGGKWLSLRRSTNRAERDGLQFSFVPACDVPALMPELEAVSNAWLGHTRAREKSFSLGSFIPDYLATQPVAIMRFEGRLVAFASVLVTDRRQSAFIDLMRFVPGVHRGMMDLLFVKTMLHLKDEGFAALNLGMAPLAGLGDQDGAPLWNQLGKTVYECGESFYNFQGLRAFKSKFEPRWESRYLAVPTHSNAYLAIMDVAMLISGGFKGMFGK